MSADDLRGAEAVQPDEPLAGLPSRRTSVPGSPIGAGLRVIAVILLAGIARSEEHPPALQSRGLIAYAVFFA